MHESERFFSLFTHRCMKMLLSERDDVDWINTILQVNNESKIMEKDRIDNK